MKLKGVNVTISVNEIDLNENNVFEKMVDVGLDILQAVSKQINDDKEPMPEPFEEFPSDVPIFGTEEDKPKTRENSEENEIKE